MNIDHHRQLNPLKDLPDNFFIIMYGMRRSGKSTTLKYLLYEMYDRFKDYKAYLFSSTAKVDPEQYSYFPPDARFSDIEMLDDELGGILDEQEAKLDVPDNKRTEVLAKNKILIILDDCVNEHTVRYSTKLNGLAVYGRHVGASVVILSQTVAGSGSVPPIIRTNADAIILCALPRSEHERELLAKQYLTAEGSKSNAFKQGIALMEKITSIQYRCMVVGMWDSSARKTKDYVYYYGPVPHPPTPDDFKIGTNDQWGNKKDESSDEDCDKTRLGCKKNNPLPNVRKMKDSDDSDDGGNDMHAGGYTKSAGITDTQRSALKYLTKGIKRKIKEDLSYLPPALHGDNDKAKLRSFVQIGYHGGCGVSTGEHQSYKWVDDINPNNKSTGILRMTDTPIPFTVLAGFSGTKSKNKTSKLKKELPCRSTRRLSTWHNIQKKKKKQ